MNRNRKRPEIVCRCNEIDRTQIETAIRNGAKTLNEIFDQTTAGVGPCGGSCRGKILHLLKTYLESGDFPKEIIDLYLSPKKF